MEMHIRKRMLMMALICLIGFQPFAQAHTVRFEIKFVGALVAMGALFNIRYVADGIGGCFKRAGDLFQYLARVKIFEDHKDLIAAKKQFDDARKKISSEQNKIWTSNVYAHIPELNNKTLDQIKVFNSKQEGTGTIIAFLEKNQKRTYDQYYSKDSNFDYLAKKSYLYIPAQTEQAINSRLSALGMDDAECEMFQQGINGAKFANIADLYQFVEHAEEAIKFYRRERNEKLITSCCGHLACETGALEVMKSELIHEKPLKILKVFSAATITRNSMNQVEDGMAEITVDCLLMALKQG